MTAKMLSARDLAGFREETESVNGTIAVVMGSFAMLQPGNLYAVERAKSLASRLCVLIETEGSRSCHGEDNMAPGGAEFVSFLRAADAVCEAGACAPGIMNLGPYIMIDCMAQRCSSPHRRAVRSSAARVVDIAPLRGCFTKDIIEAVRTGGTPVDVPGFASAAMPDLVRTVSRWREQGKKIVTVNGCFDVLHNGHARMLSWARGMGNELIVLVNDDDSVHAYKGAGRPVFPLHFRLRALGALEPVSLAHPFSGDDPLDMLSAIRPDIHVKGGSFNPDRVRGESELVRRWGGRVEFCPMVEDYSTTALIRKMTGSNDRLL